MSGSDDGGLDIHYPAINDHLQAESIESETSDRPNTQKSETNKKEKKDAGNMRNWRTTVDAPYRFDGCGASSGVGVASSLISSDWHTVHVDDQ
jgi:hypothetical protein